MIVQAYLSVQHKVSSRYLKQKKPISYSINGGHKTGNFLLKNLITIFKRQTNESPRKGNM